MVETKTITFKNTHNVHFLFGEIIPVSASYPSVPGISSMSAIGAILPTRRIFPIGAIAMIGWR